MLHWVKQQCGHGNTLAGSTLKGRRDLSVVEPWEQVEGSSAFVRVHMSAGLCSQVAYSCMQIYLPRGPRSAKGRDMQCWQTGHLYRLYLPVGSVLSSDHREEQQRIQDWCKARFRDVKVSFPLTARIHNSRLWAVFITGFPSWYFNDFYIKF